MFLSRLFGNRRKKANRRDFLREKRARRRLLLEPLESRRLLVNDVHVTSSIDLYEEFQGQIPGWIFSRSTDDENDVVTIDFIIGGTATSADHTSVSGSFQLLSGIADAGLPFNVIDDSVYDPGETVTITITDVRSSDPEKIYEFSHDPSEGRINPHIAEIFDNDELPVTISASGTPSELGLETGTFTVTRVGPTDTALTVQYSVSGTATADTDYEALDGSVTIPIGQSSAPITLTPLQDCRYEPGGETVIVTLNDDDGYDVGSPPASAELTIGEDETLPILNIGNWEGAEQGQASFAVTLVCSTNQLQPGLTSQTVTVNYSTQNSTALAGEDYTAVTNNQLTFPPGQTSRTATVSITPDTVNEANEAFNVNLSNASNASIGDGQGRSEISIAICG